MKKWESGEKANRPTLLTPSQGERSVLCSFQSGFTCKAGVKPGLLCSLQNISKCAMACFALHKTRCHMYIVQYTYVRSRCSTSNNHYKMSAKNISMPEQSHTKSTFGANHVHGEQMCPLLFGAARTLNCTPQDFLTRRASVVHLNGDRRRSLMSLATLQIVYGLLFQLRVRGIPVEKVS